LKNGTIAKCTTNTQTTFAYIGKNNISIGIVKKATHQFVCFYKFVFGLSRIVDDAFIV
jgi:hypothetical protein